jgi:hypothetical protein
MPASPDARKAITFGHVLAVGDLAQSGGIGQEVEAVPLDGRIVEGCVDEAWGRRRRPSPVASILARDRLRHRRGGIGEDRRHGVRAVADLPAQVLQPIRADVVENHVSTTSGDRASGRRADSAGHPRDQHNSLAEVDHALSTSDLKETQRIPDAAALTDCGA